LKEIEFNVLFISQVRSEEIKNKELKEKRVESEII